jgi:hypothetical protein
VALAEACGVHWAEHPDWPLAVWRHEVANDDTREGCWQWVRDKIEEEEFEGGEKVEEG